MKKIKKLIHLILFQHCWTTKSNFNQKLTKFEFSDFGGENIDFYLDLNKNFKNLNYYVINQGEINKTFIEIKKNYKFNNLNILENLNEVEKNSYDFINFGSSIQYINNYDDILTRVLKTSKNSFFFQELIFIKILMKIKTKLLLNK